MPKPAKNPAPRKDARKASPKTKSLKPASANAKKKYHNARLKTGAASAFSIVLLVGGLALLLACACLSGCAASPNYARPAYAPASPTVIPAGLIDDAKSGNLVVGTTAEKDVELEAYFADGTLKYRLSSKRSPVVDAIQSLVVGVEKNRGDIAAMLMVQAVAQLQQLGSAVVSLQTQMQQARAASVQSTNSSGTSATLQGELIAYLRQAIQSELAARGQAAPAAVPGGAVNPQPLNLIP